MESPRIASHHIKRDGVMERLNAVQGEEKLDMVWRYEGQEIERSVVVLLSAV